MGDIPLGCPAPCIMCNLLHSCQHQGPWVLGRTLQRWLT